MFLGLYIVSVRQITNLLPADFFGDTGSGP